MIVLCALGVGEWFVRRMETPYSYKALYVREHGKEISTLILGSSHTYYGLRPDLMRDSVFNLANVSQTPRYDLAILKEYAQFLPNLKRVIIPISYFTFRDPTLEEMEPNRVVQYKVGMKLPLHSDWSVYNFSIYDFAGYAGRLRSLIVKEEVNRCDSLGFGLGFDLSTQQGNWKDQTSARVADLTRENPSGVIQVIGDLNAIIDFCQRRNIDCILITTPVWKGFRSAMDKKQYAEMRHIADSLSRRRGVRYFDFFSSEIFTDEDFHDSDHLSDLGAIKLTERLRSSL